MELTWRRLVISIITLLLMVILIYALLHLKSPVSLETDQNPKIVKTLIVSPQTAFQKRTFAGKVQAGDRVDLSFEVNGQIIEFNVNEGDLVKKEQIIAKLNPRDYQNNYDLEKAKYVELQLQFQRFSTLIKSNTISQADYDKVKSDYLVAKERLDSAAKSLEDTTLKSPFDGQIGKKFVQNYQTVQAKEPIITLQGKKSLEVVIDVPEKDVIDANQNTYQISAFFDTQEIPLEIKYLGTQTDPNSLTYQVTFSLPSKLPENLNILPGMIVNVVVQIKPTKAGNNIYQIPLNAIVVDEHKKQYVWVVDEKEMRAHKRAIETTQVRGAVILVVKGLNEGEMIIIAGTNAIQEGMRVKSYVPFSQIK